MTLLYLTLAYMLGIGLGKWVWDYGLLNCDLPTWLWWIPLSLLLFTPLLHQWERDRIIVPPMRWPASAGFVPPYPPLTLTLCTGLALCLLTGILRYAAHPLTPCWTSADLAYYNLPASHAFDRQAAQLTLEGYVSTYPTREDDRQQLYVTTEKVFMNGVARPVQGVLFLQTNDSHHYGYGQSVRVSGRLTTPPDFEDFSYRQYLARRGIHSILYDAKVEPLARPLHGWWHYIYVLRARGEMLLNQSLPEPYAALANGMLLGIDGGIPDELYDQFNLAGISHVLVISGSNVALIATLALALSQRAIGPKRAVYPALTAIGGYALLVGGDAAVLRAALMGGLVVLAAAINRRSTALISLSVAGAWLTLINPLTLWDIGFQLSSMATAGLILFTPPITAWITKVLPDFQGSVLTSTQSIPRVTTPGAITPNNPTNTLFYSLIADSLIVTLAANVMVMPLIVFYFGRLSVISVAANLLVAAVQPLILLSGTVGLLIGLMRLAVVAKIFLWVTWLGLYWTTLVAQWAAQLPGASLEIATYGWGGLAITYVLIFAVRIRHLRQAWRTHTITHTITNAMTNTTWMRNLQPLMLSGLVLATGLIWGAVFTLPDGRLHVYFLNVDGGSGMLIQTPSGRQILINGSHISQRLISELGKVMPFWDRTLDLMVVTQRNSSSIDALAEIPRRLHITQAIDSYASEVESDSDIWRSSLKQTDTPVTSMQSGGWIDLGDGVALWLLWPPHGDNLDGDPGHQQSLVLKLVYNDFSMLVTGDSGLLDVHSLIGSGLPIEASLLQLESSAGNYALYDELITNVNPHMVVIHGGGNLQDNSPKAVLPHLIGSKVLQTDLAGRIHVYTDGHELWLDTEVDYWSFGSNPAGSLYLH